MAGGDKLRITRGQLRRTLLHSFAEEPRGRGGGKKRGRGHGRGRGRLPDRSQSPPPSATSISATSPLQTRVSLVRDPPVQEQTPMQGVEAEAEAEVEAEEEAEAEAEGVEVEAEGERRSPSASKSVYQRGMTRVPDRLVLQHRALIEPDGEK